MQWKLWDVEGIGSGYLHPAHISTGALKSTVERCWAPLILAHSFWRWTELQRQGNLIKATEWICPGFELRTSYTILLSLEDAQMGKVTGGFKVSDHMVTALYEQDCLFVQSPTTFHSTCSLVWKITSNHSLWSCVFLSSICVLLVGLVQVGSQTQWQCCRAEPLCYWINAYKTLSFNPNSHYLNPNARAKITLVWIEFEKAEGTGFECAVEMPVEY